MRRTTKGIARVGFRLMVLGLIFASASLVFLSIEYYLDPDKFSDKKDKTQTRKEVLQIAAQVFLGVAGLSGAYFTWQRLEVSREDQITDRFTRAIDQLGNEHLEVRLGGIYALERLAKDSMKDQETVLEVLTAFIREKSSLQGSEMVIGDETTKKESDIPHEKERKNTVDKITPKTDIQAILTVIGRREWAVTASIDLSGVYLKGANLKGANLKGANLERTNLEWARLEEADLEGANLGSAKLEGAVLNKTHFEGAILCEAHLKRTSLGNTYFTEAHLEGAHLEGARLNGVYLRGVHLDGAHLEEAHLEEAHLEQALLCGAYLQGAYLNRAHLRGANLYAAHMQGANLEKTDLEGAFLQGANLYKANLEGANLKQAGRIIPNQIKQAKNWEKAQYSDDFKTQLGL